MAAVANEIMNYLSHATGAGDTPEGIRQWWLSDRWREIDLAIVERALEGLAADGRISRRVLASGAALYFGPGASGGSGA